MVPLNSQHFIKLLFEFGLFERTALNLVQADGIDQVFGAKHPQELAHVELRNKHLLVALEDLAHVAGQRDRKSTRLNSSHRCISYAVFCLKKKKTKSYSSREHQQTISHN